MKISNILFLDIETVSGKAQFEDLNEDFQYLWSEKAGHILKIPKEDVDAEKAAAAYKDRAGIYAEFGKIICISVGFMVPDGEGGFQLRLKSFASDDEHHLLSEFKQLLEQYYNNPQSHGLCGHNIKEFDIPYICRRMLINQIPLPYILDIGGKKPWELNYLIDTLVLWKFGDYKNYTSLKLLAAAFGFPSPKDDIHGGEVGRVYWEENDLERIAVYCEKDVAATTQLYLKYKCLPVLPEDKIKSLTNKTAESNEEN